MTLTWGSPPFLWFLAVLPLVWLAYLAARTNFNSRQRLLQTAVRSLLLVAVAMALARPVLATRSSRQSIVYLVDVSHSVSTQAVHGAAAKIDELNAALRPAHSRIAAFGRTVRTVASTADLRVLAAVAANGREANALDRGGTDLEAALMTGRGELASDHVPRLVLFTDGRPTSGDTAAAIARMATERIPVSVESLEPRTIGDTWVEALELPERVTAGGSFVATVKVASQRDVTGRVELLAGEKVLTAASGRIATGVTPVALDTVVDAVGAHVLQARVTTDDDPLPANNSLARETWADPRSKVLYVERVPTSARYLSGALTGAGFDVTVRPPSALPVSAGELEPWDVVILSDVGRSSIADRSMVALAEWVEKSGGGLLFAGGEEVYGDRGYRDTPLERLAPVTFERQDEPAVALVIVLDRSWSMAGASMELTKAAAQAAVDVLTDDQLVGILTFNDKFAWDVPVQKVGNDRDAIRKKISAIGPGGHTLIYPAVEQAYLALRDAKTRAKHVILLSDGRSYPGDYEALVNQMVQARITLSSVAVGPSADPELLKHLATWGKGRSYTVADATQVPEIFVKEAKNAATPAFDEKPIKPVVKTQGFLTGVDLARLPPLRGRTATVLKDDAMELLATDEEDPLLAFWPIGLGRTAVFTSDVKDRWAADWVTWRGYGPFFAAVVRALQRQRTPAIALHVIDAPVRGKSRTVTAAVEAREPDGGYRNLLNPLLHVRTGAAGKPVPVTTRQVAPGRYEATMIVDAAQRVTITVANAPAGIGVTAQTVMPDAAAEYRFRPPDKTLLESIASSTGGTYGPTADTLVNLPGDSRTARRPLWPWLVGLALALWFVDLVLRRVRLFEASAAA